MNPAIITTNEKLKKLQDVELDILLTIDKVCKEIKLNIFWHAGLYSVAYVIMHSFPGMTMQIY